ncbi:hypothetical protein EVAR_81067_1 [Eumeta japonica]|uniref:Uncharacterized protein n=1 Tax=Eumeta variegata TaxID=151549 RepID=A0A4C1T5L2_EUMVA|nr:hypothetical protein EVAR_81067_1 [Eumeta japonica]
MRLLGVKQRYADLISDRHHDSEPCDDHAFHFSLVYTCLDRGIETRVNVENKMNGALLAVMNNKSVSRHARLAIHSGILIPTLVYGNETWAGTSRPPAATDREIAALAGDGCKTP